MPWFQSYQVHFQTLGACLLLLGFVGCSDNAPPAAVTDSASASASASAAATAFALDARAYNLKIPIGYDGSRPMPLMVVMHGYGQSAEEIESYFNLDALADARGFFVVYPQGTVDASGRRFFNANDACCDFYNTGVDDVGFVRALLDHLESTYAIDTARVFATGHSNGGFMAYRLACDLSTRFAGIMSISGATWDDAWRCTPTSPIPIIEVHGTDDVVINPAGGDGVDGYPNRIYPSSLQTVTSWARLNGCASSAHAAPDPGPIDDETSGPTNVTQWDGCGADAELWMIQGGTHAPDLNARWPSVLFDTLMAHARVSGGDALSLSARFPRASEVGQE
jgi:polyhydroxybutyrate depolymerase